MKGKATTKEQLINELAGLRQRVTELETAGAERKQAEEELRESEGKYRGLVNNVKLGVSRSTPGPTGRFLEVNLAMEEITGYPREELLQMNVSDLYVYPEEREAIIEKVASATGKVTNELRLRKKDGTEIVVSDTRVTVRDDGGRILYFDGIVEDITERKRVEEALRESEDHYRTIFQSSPIGVFHSTPEGKMTSANPAAACIFEYESPDELMAVVNRSSVAEALYVHPEKRPPAVDMALGQEGWVVFENQYRRKDGGVITGKVLFRAVRNPDGTISRLEGFIEDITERKRAEEALRESEERYRALLNLGGEVNEAVVMLQDTEQGNAIQTFVSDNWPRITGYSRKELLSSMSFFDLLHPRDREASLERHRRKVKGENIPGLFEMSIIRKDGTEVPIEVTSAYTTYQGERANVAFIRDITERKRAEEREKQLQQELALSSRLASVGELAAGVAHEINNPLTGILGFSERLLRKSTDKKVRQDLARIHDEALRVTKIVRNLQTFARRHEPKKEYLDINDILGRTLELRAYELRTGDIELVVELAPSLPEVMVDFHQMQEVFLNIILNAEQAMIEANGGGKLVIKTQKVKDNIRISFTDDGSGIPAEHLDKLFDPFFTTRGEKGGTGLGLSVCHGIVTEHNGRIYARSKPGKGAAFFVELPLIG